jgi:hypothetical protein
MLSNSRNLLKSLFTINSPLKYFSTNLPQVITNNENKNMQYARVHSIDTFTAIDGPGL